MKYTDKDFTLPPAMCPECGKVADLASGFLVDDDDDLRSDDRPQPGSFTICAGCAAVLRFTENMRMRSATEEDFEGATIEFVSAIARVASIIKQHAVTSGKPLRDVSRPN